MSETTTSGPTAHTAPGADIPLHPSDILIHLIVTFLAPMFLSATGGDITFARMAALETVNAYRLRNQADLIAIAQIVAFGLAALGSLSLSMADDLSLSMILRLRGNANALNRAAEQNRRAIREPLHPAYHLADTMDDAEFPPDPDQTEYEAGVIAKVAQTQQLGAPVRAHRRDPEPAAIQAPTPIATPAPGVSPLTEQQRQTLWATAMSDGAKEYTASLLHLPPAERKAASIRAAALSSCASHLLSGAPAPALPA